MMSILVIIVHTKVKNIILNKLEKLFCMDVHGAKLLQYLRISYKKSSVANVLMAASVTNSENSTLVYSIS